MNLVNAAFPEVSVLVCCYNSEARMALLGDSLARLEGPETGLEFLLVDNASRDGTRAGLEAIAARLGPCAKVVAEPRPGLMYARCAAVGRSMGKWVVFFDDDNEPSPDYLKQCLRLVDAYPRAVVCTGNSVLPSHVSKPSGAEDILRALALREDPGEFAFQMDRLHFQHAPFGAGLCTRGDLIRAACSSWLQGSQKVVGRQGSSLSSSEDVWLTHFLARDGGDVVFSDRLRLTHHIQAGRVEPEYLCRLAYANGRGYWNLVEAIRELRPNLEGLPKSLGSLWLREHIKGLVKVVRLARKPSLDALGSLAFSIGVLADCYFRKLAKSASGQASGGETARL
jgi:glycosyltransferase involved in cell wall biosynthesis